MGPSILSQHTEKKKAARLFLTSKLSAQHMKMYLFLLLLAVFQEGEFSFNKILLNAQMRSLSALQFF